MCGAADLVMDACDAGQQIGMLGIHLQRGSRGLLGSCLTDICYPATSGPADHVLHEQQQGGCCRLSKHRGMTWTRSMHNVACHLMHVPENLNISPAALFFELLCCYQTAVPIVSQIGWPYGWQGSASSRPGGNGHGVHSLHTFKTVFKSSTPWLTRHRPHAAGGWLARWPAQLDLR